MDYRTNVTQQWYVKVNVKWINGTAIEGARIWTLNQNGTSENGAMTDSNGDSTNVFSEILYSDFFTANYTNTTIYADFEGMQNSTNVLVNTNLDATIYITPSTVRCGETITESKTLNSDMNCTGNATIINASNIIFDCNWHTIEYARIVFGYGILSTNTENVTIKNCFITQQNASMGVNNADSIYLNNSDYTKIDNVSTRIVGSNAVRSIYIAATSHWNRINNISIYQVPTPCIGIYVLSSGVASATTNISNFNITMWGGTYALQTDAGTKKVKIENGTIDMFGGTGGIYFIRGNTAYGSDGFSEIRNVSFFMNASGQNALVLRESLNDIFENITITSTGATSLGLSFTIGGNYNHTFKNIHINMTQLGSTHINFDRINANLFFENVTFSGQSITQITKTTATYYSGNNTFLNPSGFNRSAMTYDTADIRNNLTLQWYARVNVTTSSGTPVNGAIVNSTNEQGIWQDFGTTGADGLTQWFVVNDTMFRGDVSNISYALHNISASGSGILNSSNFTMNLTSTINVILESDTGPKYLNVSSNYPGAGGSIIAYNLTFNCSATTNETLSQIGVRVWNASALVYQNASSVSGTTNESAFFAVLTTGSYNYSCNASSSSLTNFTTNKSFTFTGIPRYLNITNVQPSGTFVGQTFNFTCRGQTNETLATIGIRIWNASALVYQNSTTLLGTDNQTNFTATLAYGNYNYSCNGSSTTLTNYSTNTSFTNTAPPTTLFVTNTAPAGTISTPLFNFTCSAITTETLATIGVKAWNASGLIYQNSTTILGTSNSTQFQANFAYGSYNYSCNASSTTLSNLSANTSFSIANVTTDIYLSFKIPQNGTIVYMFGFYSNETAFSGTYTPGVLGTVNASIRGNVAPNGLHYTQIWSGDYAEETDKNYLSVPALPTIYNRTWGIPFMLYNTTGLQEGQTVCVFINTTQKMNALFSTWNVSFRINESSSFLTYSGVYGGTTPFNNTQVDIPKVIASGGC